MIVVGIRELKQRTSELVRLVRQEGAEIEVTYRGETVALLIPFSRTDQNQKAEDAWASLNLLSAEINARWPEGVSALEAVQEGRE